MSKEFVIVIIGVLFIGIIAINMTLFMIEEMIHRYSKYKKKDTKKYRKNNTIVLTLARQSDEAKADDRNVIVYTYTKYRKNCDNFSKPIIEDFYFKNSDKIAYGIYGDHTIILDLYAKHMYRYNCSTSKFDLIPCRIDGETIYISEFDEKENIYKDFKIGFVGRKDFEANGIGYIL